MFAISSEPQTLVTEAQESWEIQFAGIGDPHHEIRDDCAQRGFVDVFCNTIPGEKNVRFWDAHPKGFFQPAVLSVHKSGRVLYRWRCVPKHSNMSGAGPRPEAAYTWDKIKAAMDSEHDADFDKNPVLGEKSKSWYRFLLILIVYGWFLTPRTFAMAREGGGKTSRCGGYDAACVRVCCVVAGAFGSAADRVGGSFSTCVGGKADPRLNRDIPSVPA